MTETFVSWKRWRKSVMRNAFNSEGSTVLLWWACVGGELLCSVTLVSVSKGRLSEFSNPF